MRILIANPGFGTPITEEGVIDFLANSKLNLHLSTVDEKGDPNIHQTWSFHGSTLELGDNQNKPINLENHDTFSFYIDEQREGRY